MAVINTATVLALASGYTFIRRGNQAAHRASMAVAIVLGIVFLALYLTYHFGSGLARFGGIGIIRPIYFTILIAHILCAALATVIVPLAVVRAVRGRFDAHRRLAPFAWRLWMFVAVSGVTVYVMTIHVWPYTGGVR